MRIGIITLPLHANYGGILQAYALQTTLERMGHEVKVIEQRRKKRRIPLAKVPYVIARRTLAKYIKGKNIRIFDEHYYNTNFPIWCTNTGKFIKKHIHRDIVDSFKDIKEDDFDAYVVGSDQVWRPSYFNTMLGSVEIPFLGFTNDWTVKRIAYAASFSVDNWEYNNIDGQRAKDLARKFDAVSVREDSGVGLCKRYLDVDAKHVLDPTMLLDAADYLKLLDNMVAKPSNGDLFTYILNEDETKLKVIGDAEQKFNLKRFSVGADFGLTKVQPPVEQWLQAFKDAKLVITDSFHGTVFSILFHKPFIVLGNKARGNSRIESLLKTFDLQGHLYNSNGDLRAIATSNLDVVNLANTLDTLRKDSLQVFDCLK